MVKKALFRTWIISLTILLVTLFMEPNFAWAKVELKFYHAMTRHRQKVLEDLVNQFNRQNPDIKIIPIQIRSMNRRMGNNYHALYKAILENLARKTPPDIAQVYENWTVQLKEIGAIIPLGDYVGTYIPEEDINDLVPVFKDANTFDGKLWTLPFNKSIYVLYYNKEMFRKAGVKPPKTWDEFRTVSKKLTIRNGDSIVQYGIAFRPSVDIFGHYLYAYGGTFIKNNRAAFDSPVGVANLQFWVTLVHQDRSALVSFADRREFASGRSAMYIDTTSRIGRFKNKLNFDWGVAPLPKGTVRRYQFAGTNIAIFSHLSPEKKKAAIKFARFLISKDATLYWALNTGYLPVRKSAIQSKEYQNLIKKDPRYGVGVEELDYAVCQPKLAAWEMIRGIIDDAMFEAMSLRKSPQVALNMAAKMSNHLIKNILGKQ